MSVLPLEADIHQGDGYVSFVPIRDSCTAANQHLYSITSSVRASSIGERSTPEVPQRIDGRTIDVDDDHLQVGWCGPTQPLVAGGLDHSVAGEPTEPCGSF